jgi:hypothetical protein
MAAPLGGIVWKVDVRGARIRSGECHAKPPPPRQRDATPVNRHKQCQRDDSLTATLKPDEVSGTGSVASRFDAASEGDHELHSRARCPDCLADGSTARSNAILRRI